MSSSQSSPTHVMFCIYARPGSTNLIPWHQDLVGFCWLFLWFLRAILAWGLESEDWISMSSGQIIATSHDQKPPKGRECFLFQAKLGWWNIIVWPDVWIIFGIFAIVFILFGRNGWWFWSQWYYNIFSIWPQCHVLFLGKTRSFWCHLQPSRTPIPPMWVLVGRLLKLKKLPNRIQSPCSLANVMNDRWVGAILPEMRSRF